MMRKIIVTIWITSALFMLGGCISSNMGYANQQLYLQLDNSFVQLDGRLLGKRGDSYGSLSIEQKILKLKEGNLVVFEDAQTDIQYEFEPDTARSIKVIFDARRTYIVYAKGNLYAYQLLLQDGKMLNIIAQQDNSQRLRAVYGLTSEQMDSILHGLDADAKNAYFRDVLVVKETKKP